MTIERSAIKASRMRAHLRQCARVDRTLLRLERLSYQYSWLRMALFLVGAAATTALFFTIGAAAFFAGLLVSILLFALLVRAHRRNERQQVRFQSYRNYIDTQLARATLDWAHLPPPTAFTPDFSHPFESDLDLIGPNSLHHLLDVASSAGGSNRLRHYLSLRTTSAGESLHRQALVAELRPRARLRARLHVAAQQSTASQSAPDRLVAWLVNEDAAQTTSRRQLLLVGLALLNVGAFLLNWAGLLPPIWQVTLFIYVVVYFYFARALRSAFQDAAALADVLGAFGRVSRELERFSYRGCPSLRTLCTPFWAAEQRPSQQLARVLTVVHATAIQGNPIVWMALNLIFPWDYTFARLLQKTRQEIRIQAPHWLQIWYEVEALSSLANLGYLNPDYVFPTIVPTIVEEAPGERLLDAVQLGHPLILDTVNVRNDFHMSRVGEVVILTGSNMSGKSTFLKALGVNLALAAAGAPVCAQQLSMAAMRIFTSIRVSDSVVDGISYFYAEVKRLKALLEALEEEQTQPLFFCIDEIFRGTNNRERLEGSRAYIRALVSKAGIGLISTHDLELVHLADQVAQISNYHFADQVTAGTLTFDYQLRPGPCPTTNALKIMAHEGLPVPPPG